MQVDIEESCDSECTDKEICAEVVCSFNSDFKIYRFTGNTDGP